MKAAFKRQISHGEPWERLKSSKILPNKLRGDDSISMRIYVMGEPRSGSSAIANGFRKIYGFSRERQLEMDESGIDFIAYKSHSIKIALDTMIETIKRIEASGFKFGNPESRNDADKVRDYKLRSVKMEVPKLIWASLRRIWEDTTFQHCVQGSTTNTEELEKILHCFSSIERMRSSKYVPSMEDVVLCHKHLNGISETPLQKNLWLIEVAPIRSPTQFKRLFQFFNGGTIVVYCVDISKYDQVDESGENILLKSLKLFKCLSTDPDMRGVPILVFFTNEQEFDIRLQRRSISVCFPEYKGKNNKKDSYQHVRRTFENCVEKYRFFSLLVPNTFPQESDVKPVKRTITHIAIEMQADDGEFKLSLF